MAHRAGYAAIVGRPNVGKSTLLNALVGAKVAIVTPKPQTTRNRILGIRTLPEAQVVFLDTPGIHEARSLLNRRMVEVARQALGDADVVVLVVEATAGVTPADGELARGLAALARPTVVVLSKLDLVRPPVLLPAMEAIGRLLPGREIIPVGADGRERAGRPRRGGEGAPRRAAALPRGRVHRRERAPPRAGADPRAALLPDRGGDPLRHRRAGGGVQRQAGPARRARHHPGRPPEPPGDRHRGTRHASRRDRTAGAARAGGRPGHQGVPRALRARRAGLGQGCAPP